MEDSKACNICKQIKPLSEFTRNKSKPGGYDGWCKPCRSERRRAEYAANPEVSRLKNKQSYERNKAAYIERAYKWHQANRAKSYKIRRNYVLTRPGLASSYSNAYRTKKRNSSVLAISNRFLKKLYSSACIYCGSRENIHADHVVPISRGGIHSEGNLVPACRTCNVTKNNRFIMEWKLKRKAPR